MHLALSLEDFATTVCAEGVLVSFSYLNVMGVSRCMVKGCFQLPSRNFEESDGFKRKLGLLDGL